ncbi:hydroxyacid dehydrogenase [Azohydromonas lata]|uniref:hydroxyacid dehydrogenase n=1 Tax=Azohydromonas lata TaxID=45677 RepID=UPI0008301466|nr:hydroxyacid dehydrogenase [Azohydromonas lata]
MSARPVVLLTGPMDPAGEARIAAVAEVRLAGDTSAATLRRLVAQADVLVVRSALPADLLEHAPRLRGIVRHGVGVDMIPVEAASARGIPVANVPGSNRHAVAEHVMGAIQLLRRGSALMDQRLRRDGWEAARALADGARELHGATLGLVGVGDIGRRVAEIAAFGYGMKVLGHQRRLDALPPFVEGCGLDTLCERCDALVLACALTEGTRGLIDARRLGLLKADAVLVNVSRGAVLDEAALLHALATGRLHGAALDVFTTQPLPAGHPLLALPNVLLSPHAAGLTVESMRRMSEGTADAVLCLLQGRRPPHCVNVAALPPVG